MDGRRRRPQRGAPETCRRKVNAAPGVDKEDSEADVQQGEQVRDVDCGEGRGDGSPL
jgi:hypothetical protein